MTHRRNTLARRFAWPVVIALATAAGLAAGLIGDGGWDVAAAVGLAVPVVAGAGALRTRFRVAAQPVARLGRAARGTAVR